MPQTKKSGNTPLISAALNNHWEMVATLLDAAPSGSVTAVNNEGEDLLKLLLTGTAHKALGADFGKILAKVVLNGHNDGAFSAYAFQRIAERCDAGLLDAARKAIPDNLHHPLRDKLFAEKLLRITAGINSDKSGVITYLLSLKNGAGSTLVDPNAECARGFTALMKASSIGKTDNVKCLLKDGRVKGQINKENPKKRFAWTAYTSAHYHGCRVTMRILKDHGATSISARSILAEEQRAREAHSNTSSGGGSGGFILESLGNAIGAGIATGFGGGSDD
ncbi:ankyrin repeat domain-containing protein [Endozoicomonas euniceicola]|uniref:Ankyrin repeat domain-containing protein n=1 Tax=Endozoicomonas euniceicola TaxID=1234143 RepID=A0ABY6GUD9_9GAMM|nr:ankyrin repeat domain-containing protein [Endozoicomonas euniceicola]UYM16388.1 ankyrin repeat domain-containing protein [Endozoicomonas euniceicola]